MFDLDGTLYDTERANYLAYQHACTDICGIEIDENFFHRRCMSRNYKEFLPLLGVPDEKLSEIHFRKKNIYSDFFSEIRSNTLLFGIADSLRESGTKLCLVTTASAQNTAELLDYFGRSDYFDFVITQDMVSELKPSPQCYLAAMEYFNATSEECIIFEDSDIGLAAAHKSGAAVFCVDCFARGRIINDL